MAKEITKERVDEYIGKMRAYCDEHNAVLERMSGLTYGKLKRDLEEAVQYQRGYYKNEKGEYRYVKGIEVTNDTGNLCRMGMNGEDRGVWVHFCEISDRRASYCDVPICRFTSKHDARFTKPDELMKPTTREDFEEQVRRTIQNIIADYPDAVDAQNFLDVMNGYEAIEEEYSDVANSTAAIMAEMTMVKISTE